MSIAASISKITEAKWYKVMMPKLYGWGASLVIIGALFKIQNWPFAGLFLTIGLTTEAERLYDIRRNRLNSLKENEASDYTNLDKIRNEVEQSKKIFKKNKWPVIDVTRKSVEETAASIIKIFEIQKKNG